MESDCDFLGSVETCDVRRDPTGLRCSLKPDPERPIRAVHSLNEYQGTACADVKESAPCDRHTLPLHELHVSLVIHSCFARRSSLLDSNGHGTLHPIGLRSRAIDSRNTVKHRMSPRHWADLTPFSRHARASSRRNRRDGDSFGKMNGLSRADSDSVKVGATSHLQQVISGNPQTVLASLRNRGSSSVSVTNGGSPSDTESKRKSRGNGPANLVPTS
jgi:hypothetical protein